MDIRKTFRFLYVLFVVIMNNLLVLDCAWAQDINTLESFKKCLTCHPDIKNGLTQKVVHRPFKDFKCSDCHNPHAAKYGKLLKEDIGTLCTSCHRGEKKPMNKNYRHSPFNEGECLSCHRPHASQNANLLKAKGEQLCFDCHAQEKFSKKYRHEPVKKGQCLKCHRPHASSHETLVKKEPKELCMVCHSYKNRKLRKFHFGYPVQNKDCTLCHNPHSSKRTHLVKEILHKPVAQKKCASCHNGIHSKNSLALKIKGASVCLECHPAKRKDFNKINSHVGEGVFCVNCHSPHASKEEHLKKQKEAKLCLRCHEDTKQEITNKNNQHKHPLVKEGKCSSCHRPHGSNFRLFFGADEIKVCTSCHEKHAKFTHPIGKNVIDPRSKRDITCITCHELMGTSYQFALRFDRKKQLCIQCHKGY